VRIAGFVGQLVERHAVAILVVVLVLSALAAWSAMGTSIVTTQDAFLSTDSEAFQGYRAYAKAFGGDSMLVLIPGTPAELANAKTLRGLRDLEATLDADARIQSVVSPLTLLKAAGIVGDIDLSTAGAALQAALAAESLRTQLERFFRNNHVIVAVRLEGDLDSDEQTEAASFIQKTVAAGPFAPDAIVAGTPRLIADVESAIFSGLARTGAIAVVLMVLVLFLAFPARWRLLSLPVVLVGVLWTFGVAAALDVPLTLITLAGLPILIGLGVDFAIQFHNRYEEQMRRGEKPAVALIDAISHIAPTVGVAVAVMVLGFVTLLLSAVPGVQDFGILLAIGAVVLYLVAVFVLNSFLYRFDRQPRAALADSAMAGAGRGFRARARGLLARDWLFLGTALPVLARWSRRHAAWVVAAALLLAALGLVADRDLTVQTDIQKLIPTDTPGVVALNKARDVVGGSTELPFLIKAPDVTAPSFTRWMATFQEQAVMSHPEIAGVSSLTTSLGMKAGDQPPSRKIVAAALDKLPTEIRDGLVTADRTGASVTFTMSDMETATLNKLIDDLLARADPPPGVTLTSGGLTTLTARTVEAFTRNRGLVTGIGIAVVLIGLLLIYRDWRRALIAVVPIALVTGWSSGLMWVVGIDLNPLTAVLGALVIAIGTEFTVLLMSRYWEERAKGIVHDLAMEEAVTKVGRAITASALTVAAGFGALISSDFPALRDFGVVIVVDVVFALIATVTVVPALAHWLDRGEARLDVATAGEPSQT